MTNPSPTGAPQLPPDAIALLSKLNHQRVEFVLAGELAAAAQGGEWADDTVVVAPARFARNLERLSRALRGLDAQWRVAGESEALDVDLSAGSLRRLGVWPLRTDLGDLDIDFEPPGTAGHLDLFEGARRLTLARGVAVEVASLDDLIRIAEMRGAPSDQSALPMLRAVREHGALSSAS